MKGWASYTGEIFVSVMALWCAGVDPRQMQVNLILLTPEEYRLMEAIHSDPDLN